jgi:hypothetical protein
MNQQERDELRAKHQPVSTGHYGEIQRCSTCVQQDPEIPEMWAWVFYPCDTIRILDGFDELEKLEAAMRKRLGIPEGLVWEVKSKTECEHITGAFLEPDDTWDYIRQRFPWEEFTYCPKCGEKL